MPASAGTGPLALILLAQSLSASAELLGQRLARRVHRASSLRMLCSMCLYCAAQGVLVLGAGELLLPSALTGGQGPFTLPALLWAHPAPCVANGVNNALYWTAITILLREPLGAMLVVLAFLCAALAVGALQTAVGLDTDGSARAPALAVALGLAGAVLAVTELPLPLSEYVCARMWGDPLPAATPPAPTTTTVAATAVAVVEAEEAAVDDAAALEAGKGGGGAPGWSPVASEDPGDDGAAAPVAAAAAVAATAATVPLRGGGGGGSAVGAGSWLHSASILAAFLCVAGTTAVGIVLATWMEARSGFTAFGYLAADQVMLPLATLPLVALLEHVPALRRLVGEPRWSDAAEGSPGLLATLGRTWDELKGAAAPPPGEEEEGAGEGAVAVAAVPHDDREAAAPAAGTVVDAAAAPASSASSAAAAGWVVPAFFTLAGFHGLELMRAFFFYHLVTSYDAETTYLLMTLLRVALVAGASLLACTLLRRCVGLRAAEAAAALHPLSLATRAVGAALITASVLLIKTA